MSANQQAIDAFLAKGNLIKHYALDEHSQTYEDNNIQLLDAYAWGTDNGYAFKQIIKSAV